MQTKKRKKRHLSKYKSMLSCASVFLKFSFCPHQLWLLTNIVVSSRRSVCLCHGGHVFHFTGRITQYWCSKKESFSQASRAHGAALISVSCSPQLHPSRSCKTTDTGLVHRVMCPFTAQLSLVLINRPRKDGTLSWRWYTAAAGGIRTCNLEITSPAPYHKLFWKLHICNERGSKEAVKRRW